MKFENTEVFNFEGALRGMRLPLKSGAKADSHYCLPNERIDCGENIKWTPYKIGENDMDLAQRLVGAGNEHSKFLRQIFVSVDITAPEYWWLQCDTYKIGTTSNSTSKMHKLLARPFTPDDFEIEDTIGYRKYVEQKFPEIDEEKEEWREWSENPVYFISSYGRVLHKDFIAKSGRIVREKMLAPITTNDGYITYYVVDKDGNGKQRRAHRLVAQTFIPNDNPKRNEVNHINGNKLDNRVENLEWCTSSENQQHAVVNKLQPNAVCTYSGKFTKEEREKIIEEFNTTNISARQLAIKYGCSHTTMLSLLKGKYLYQEHMNIYNDYFLPLLKTLNDWRDAYLNATDSKIKNYYWNNILRILPMCYRQTRTWTANYAVLRNIYMQRCKTPHKLGEWRAFGDWILSLPYSSYLLTYGKE